MLLSAFFFCTSTFADSSLPTGPSILVVDISGPITPATADLLDDALNSATGQGARMLIIKLDTPGGLLDSARRMVRAILTSELPVAVWVGPDGAHAASAGVFLVAASHVAAMAPSTSMGAASPVELGGGDMSETMSRKVQNDLLSLLRSIVTERKRNVQWYEASVTDAATVDAAQAVLNRVVEYTATDIPDFLQQVAARGITFNGRMMRIHPEKARIQMHDPGVRYQLLSWLLHPQVAYLLFLGGLAGLFFELTTPGAIFPGVIGGLCLLLGLYALSVLPTTAAGVLLILFGLVLFLLEIKIISHGLLAVAGTAALFTGSMILFQHGPSGFALPILTIAVTVGGIALLVGAGVLLAGRAQLSELHTGISTMVGERVTVRHWNNGSGRVVLHGVLWNAQSPASTSFSTGDEVYIVAVEGLTLIVDPNAPTQDTPLAH